LPASLRRSPHAPSVSARVFARPRSSAAPGTTCRAAPSTGSRRWGSSPASTSDPQHGELRELEESLAALDELQAWVESELADANAA
jgi:hypothetical protein